ncbi:hypothetical protein ASG46_10220 [Bacillus sp. Leaf49]|uniref:hypothetical protein n=1 Tax=Bacillus sp. Leaf49 TaxID=1736222 RepID=UPI0006FACBAF|nr:hypothetical protein [Bacillus sp. Leaf49]KQU11570.1 hypothetical protein ASG46_10220 [Bacillus sp. Leaf49]
MEQLDKLIDAQQKAGERLDEMFATFEDNLFMSESKKTDAYFENLHKKRNDNNGEIVFGNVRPIVDTLYRGDETYGTVISGYEIDYYADEEVPEGVIKFNKELLGKTYNETAANVRKMLYRGVEQ